MFTQNLTKLSGAVHELSSPQAFLLYLAMVKHPTTSSLTSTFALWPWNSVGFVRLWRNMIMQNFIELSAAVKLLFLRTEKKRKQYSPSLVRWGQWLPALWVVFPGCCQWTSACVQSLSDRVVHPSHASAQSASVAPVHINININCFFNKTIIERPQLRNAKEHEI